MSHTAIIRLHAPAQLWASKSLGPVKKSLNRPTKSGVIGLIANAMGRDFSDTIDDLAAMTFSVRVDNPGIMMGDVQTAGGGEMPILLGERARRGSKTPSDECDYLLPRNPTKGLDGSYRTEWSNKAADSARTKLTILSDATFTVGMGGDPELVHSVIYALNNPARPLFLGKKGFIPVGQVGHSVIEGSAWFRSVELADGPDLVRTHLEVNHPSLATEVVNEQPTTFQSNDRSPRTDNYGPLLLQTGGFNRTQEVAA